MKESNVIHKSVFNISKMDCPSEENLIRMKLDSLDCIEKLEFDIPARNLIVYHSVEDDNISKLLDDLNLGSNLKSSELITDQISFSEESLNQKKLLWIVLIINFGFFVIEMSTGIIAKSMGLIADSLDMFADAAVYGLSLLAVGQAVSRKKLVAKIAGYFQLILAFLGIIEVVRRFIGGGEVPDFQTMIIVAALALIANIISLLVLQKSKSDEAHMKASMIFTSNDIIINAGVIIAGIMVNVLNSQIPDLVIGAIVFIIVFRGAKNILSLSK